MRRLIINADDFRLTAGVNRAIVEAHQRGIVTSTTLMANSGAFEAATAIARADNGGRFSVGCHVVLMDGGPLLSPDNVPTLLVPRNGATPRFRESLNDFVIASFRHKLNPDETDPEAPAQLARPHPPGIPPSHSDTHHHAHRFPAALRPLLRAARSRGVTAVRNPFGQVWPLPLNESLAARGGRCGSALPSSTCYAILPEAFVARSKPTGCAPPTVR